MKDDKQYLKEIYEKYEQEENNMMYFKKTKNKYFLRNVASIMLVIVLGSTGVFAGIKIYENLTLKPSFSEQLSNNSNNIWCGTFNLVWNDLMDEVVGGPIEFEGYESNLANQLNKQSFKVDMLSQDSYFKISGKRNLELKEKIQNGIKDKFNETSNVIDDIDWNSPLEGYVLYAMLKKEFEFIHPFNVLDDDEFGDSNQKVKYFGINQDSPKKLYSNVEVLFYNSDTDFAVRLITKQNEDVILYRTNNSESFEKIYEEILTKQEQYDKKKTNFTEYDTLKVPNIKVAQKVSYDELCNKYIKGTKMYIDKALQTVDISLDNKGGKLISEAIVGVQKECIVEDSFRVENRNFDFTDNFVMFLKENDKEKPYFAIYVNDDQVLVK